MKHALVAAAAVEEAAVSSAVATASTLVPQSVSTLPTLPSSSYPAGKLVWLTTTNVLYVSSGTAWTPNGAVAGSITGSIAGSQIQAGSIGAVQIAANSITAAQIEANTITAGQLAAGAVTASMITSGTLNADLVDVINLNASNITTGTLSANQVLFTDGTSVSTAARFTSVQGTLTSAFPLPTTRGPITNCSFTVPSSSTTDAYNIYASFLFQYYNGSSYITGSQGTVNIALYVDGSLYAGPWATGAIPPLMYVTGLGAGSHTIALYGYANEVSNQIATGGYAICQHFN
jgi:hypothetical protein